MNPNLALGLSCGALAVLLSACASEVPVSLVATQPPSPPPQVGVRLLTGSELLAFLPDSVARHKRSTTASLLREDLDATEGYASYLSDSGSPLTICLADMAKQPQLYEHFLSGGGLYQGSRGNSFGLSFSQASLQGSANYGLVIGQASQASFGQASGVLGLAQHSQATLFTLASQGSTASLGSNASVLFSQTSPTASQASHTLNLGQASSTVSQASAELQASGVDFDQLSQVSQNSPAFSLSQSSASDGSYIAPFASDLGYDVAGWELFDQETQVHTFLLGVCDRVAILVEAYGVKNPAEILAIAESIDYAGIEAACGTAGGGSF